MSAMQPQITEWCEWLEMESSEGTFYFPADHFSEEEVMSLVEQPVDIIRIEGYGARLSMPGYMDCTEWSVFSTIHEAAEYLLDMFYDMPDDEMSDEEQSEARQLRIAAKREV